MEKNDTTNAINRENLNRICMLHTALGKIEGRWKSALIMKIHKGFTRFGKLKLTLSGISEKMLAQQLKELEQDGLVSKTIFPEVPPRTEYALTERGQELQQLLDQLCNWGLAHFSEEKMAIPLE